MRTNSFIKLINTELNRELREKNLSNRSVRRRELQEYVDKMKNKIELFVKEQVKNNTIALIRCECKHLEDSHFDEIGCESCACSELRPRGRTPLILALQDDPSDDILYVA